METESQELNFTEDVQNVDDETEDIETVAQTIEKLRNIVTAGGYSIHLLVKASMCTL